MYNKMENQIYLLFSKFSNNSTKLLEIIEASPFNFRNIKLTPICIDDENIRNKILKSSTFKITYVPCIIIIYSNGNVEQFEGTNAFGWVEEIKNKYIASQPRPQPIEEPINIKQSRKTKNKESDTSKLTLIEDLDSEDKDETNTDDDYDLPKPPASIRAGPGNFESDAEFGEQIQINRTVTRGIKNSGENNGKKESLMATAMEMQKSRDKDDSKKNPNPAFNN